MNAELFAHQRRQLSERAGRSLRLLAVAAVFAVLASVAAAPGLAGVAVQAPVLAPSQLAPAYAAGSGPIGTALSELPLRFITNAGQTHSSVYFTVRGAGHTLFFAGNGVVFSAVQGQDRTARRSIVRLSFLGANARPIVEGRLPLPGSANFFVGSDPAHWQMNVPTYAAVAYRDLYPGVDLVYSGSEGQLKSEFRLAPGADPRPIRLVYGGIDAARLLPDGSLSLHTSLGELTDAAPVVYQEVNGARREIAGRYRLLAQAPPQVSRTSGVAVAVGFEIGAYDPSLPLVIDPILGYSSYLGGNRTESANGVAVDDANNVYVVGQTASDDFPTDPEAIQPTRGLSSDAFVTQLIRTGDVYTYGYSTYLGGNDVDFATGVAVNDEGDASIVGVTRSTDFPVFNAPQQKLGGTYDAFVTRIISQSGVYTFAYSTYLGGSRADYGRGVALDSADNAFVVGETTSSNLFTTPTAIQPACAGVGCNDAFVAQIIASGTYTFGYSSYLGGAGVDRGLAIAIDSSDGVFVTGDTSSIDFPILNAPQPIWGVASLGLSSAELEATAAFTYPDAFVTQIINSGTYTYAYSTYLGGAFADAGRGIAADSAGNAMVTGNTGSADFPITPDTAVQPTHGGGGATSGGDAFVTLVVNASGVYTFGYSTFVGGESDDIGYSIVVDDNDNAVVVGETHSDDFPVRYAFYGDLRGAGDAFVTQLISTTGSYTFGLSTYLGGSGTDFGYAVNVDDTGDIYVTGQTKSDDFPVQSALDDDLAGASDAFVTRIGWGGLMISKTATPTVVAPSRTVAYTLIYTNDSPTVAYNVVISDYLPIPITFTRASYVSSGAAVTPTGSFSFTWQVADLGQGQGGTIIVNAVLSHTLTPGAVITNTAYITSPNAYSNSTHSSASAVITVGRGLYMPIVKKQP